MRKIYHHTFKGGESVTMTVDFSQTPVSIAVNPFGLVNKFPEEYRWWVDTVLMPDFMNHLSPDQLRQIVKLYRDGAGR